MDEFSIDLKHSFQLIQRGAWLLILGLFLGGVVGFLISMYVTPMYQAGTKVMVSRVLQDQSSDVTASLNTIQLTETYVQLLKTNAVLDATSQRMGQPLNPKNIKAQAIPNTQIISITVRDKDPQRATLIANTLVSILIERSDTIQSGRYISMEENLIAQKSQLETQIADLQDQINQASLKSLEEQKKWIQDQITSLQAEAAALKKDIAAIEAGDAKPQTAVLDIKKARQLEIQTLLPLYQQSYTALIVNGESVKGALTTTDSQLSILQTSLSLYQQIYASILDNLASVRLAAMNNTPNVVQIEVATVPSFPILPRKLSNTVWAAALGVILAGLGIGIKGVLDVTVKTKEEIEKIAGAPVVGFIAQTPLGGKNLGSLSVDKNPRSPFADAFRSLRANMEFAAVDFPLKTIAVTSPGPGEGKTTISCNLAMILAQGGAQVVLLDADFRKARVHQFMGISNRLGLSDLFRGHSSINDIKRATKDLPGLEVITSGCLPPNPTELLDSLRMKDILADLKNQTDFIVLDCPPMFLPDTQVLAGKADGVLVVVYPEHTHREALALTVEQLKRAGAKIIGVVMNGIPRNRASSLGRYYYTAYGKEKDYYSEEAQITRKNKKPRSFHLPEIGFLEKK